MKMMTTFESWRGHIHSENRNENTEVLGGRRAIILMKVITIKEPWASKILNGEKTIETRTWKTNYRGPILLHASKNPKSEISGKIFARAILVDIQMMTKQHEKEACCEIYPRANSWFLEDITPTSQVNVKGKLGLWELD